MWVGETLSELGSQACTIALPLLVLALTGSPAKAGLTGFARALGYPVSALPGGVLCDRVDRRRVMIACALIRALAMGSIPLALALGRPPLGQLMAVAFLDTALFTVSAIAERGLLPSVVPEAVLGDAVSMNEARAAVGFIAGPPLGGALFGLARGLPFVANAGSFVAEVLALLGLRLPPAQPRPAPAEGEQPGMLAEIREGATWLWRAPFLRDGSLLYAGANLTMGAVELLGVLVARHHGASSAEIGLAYAIVGAGGLLSAGLAGPARRRLSTRLAVISEPWFHLLFLPLLLLCRSGVTVGLTIGAMLLPMVLSSSVVVGQRLALTPDRLRGRVQASASFISATVAWAGPLAIGFLFQAAGETAAVLALTGWALLVAAAATASPGLRQPPGGEPEAVPAAG